MLWVLGLAHCSHQCGLLAVSTTRHLSFLQQVASSPFSMDAVTENTRMKTGHPPPPQPPTPHSKCLIHCVLQPTGLKKNKIRALAYRKVYACLFRSLLKHLHVNKLIVPCGVWDLLDAVWARAGNVLTGSRMEFNSGVVLHQWKQSIKKKKRRQRQ